MSLAGLKKQFNKANQASSTALVFCCIGSL